ncbi:hypothetical protein MKW98_016739 [Papaver atlanticum]|uniref:Uncharacterized protein n=1 Tax=Papaver atlanticum TaxID=357466 RepID=A0AAD4TK04_9MAGN|nr:hypothetical protein MKW98_016739 [Papaver atlanticum]
MNQLSRFCVCRSVLRRNPFARWSAKPISSSLISSNPTSSNLIMLISKFHHTFNFPPTIFSTPGNRFRKFSGEPVGGDPAAAESNFGDDDLEDEISEEDDLKYEIFELHEEICGARENIELCTLPPLDAVKIPADKLKAIMENFGLDNLKYPDYPPHLQRFEKEIEFGKECVREIVDFGKYAAAGKYRGPGPNFRFFRKWCDAGGMEDLKSFESKNECDTLPTAQDQIPVPVDCASLVAGTHQLSGNHQ